MAGGMSHVGVLARVARWWTVERPTKLHRWCGMWSEAYTHCTPMLKGSLADCDNSLWSAPPPRMLLEPAASASLDPVSRVAADYHI